MESIITEKNYPVRKIWIFKFFFGKNILYYILPTLMIVAYFAWKKDTDLTFMPFFTSSLILISPLFLFVFFIILRVINFHYTFDEQWLTVRQGIIAKQTRSMPYEVFQNVLTQQDFFDRIFGTASLIIENATQLPRLDYRRERLETSKNILKAEGLIGAAGNKIIIPGLKKIEAEQLKGIVLRKMKEHPTADIQAGL
jgi:uncharacterized membrane protein YdbT with pleckstrin-like domain